MARKRTNEEMIRSLAVTLVDGRHGFTMEFATSPAGHSAEYDEMERDIRMALDVNKMRLAEPSKATV